MSEQSPVVVLVHGAFAESASWNGVIDRLQARGVEAVAVANPLRSVRGDATYLRDVIAGIGRPVLLVGHSYGGIIITGAAGARNPAVVGLVYVAAFAPSENESAFELSSRHPGSTLGDALTSYPVSSGGDELAIRRDLFHEQFCADVPADVAARLASTQRPVTQQALTDGLPTDEPGWTTAPSWFVIAQEDRNIPAAELRDEAQRAGARAVIEIEGASHAVSVSHPEEVVETILTALAAVTPAEAA
ncbi:Pimeloyl-ACP methyl ester carboxylesterase [Nocardioides terrae]|uniref:Pimeloyl-ACP methyl ester carboxylesterase n=1 Tax=Nocardioides terrae TaxID=574651 RepID=A0A1I1P376_9ACTN|nr:alpha/beta hydrolase [Nocardioides terrae]SFD04277.1 Pimeloyl-ACP methyl ester carboxylesterase [Nocardioides terrae]